jgi:hypothetical protein
MRLILGEAAQAAAKTASQFKGRFQGLTINLGLKRTTISIAPKILKIGFPC